MTELSPALHQPHYKSRSRYEVEDGLAWITDKSGNRYKVYKNQKPGPAPELGSLAVGAESEPSHSTTWDRLKAVSHKAILRVEDSIVSLVHHDTDNGIYSAAAAEAKEAEASGLLGGTYVVSNGLARMVFQNGKEISIHREPPSKRS